MVNYLITGAIGYGVCVLFPIPYLNQAIINGWKKLFNTGTTTTTK